MNKGHKSSVLVPKFSFSPSSKGKGSHSSSCKNETVVLISHADQSNDHIPPSRLTCKLTISQGHYTETCKHMSNKSLRELE